MKILLLVPDIKGQMGIPAYPHIGLAYITSYLTELGGHSVMPVDLRVSSFNHVKEWLKQFHYDFIGITSSDLGYKKAYELINNIKKITNTPIVIGGPHVSTNKANVLRQCKADYAIKGEGEVTFSELCAGFPVNQIDGLIWRDDYGIHENPDRPPITDLDALPFPAYNKFHTSKYSLTEIPIVTSRGCPYNCLAGDTIIHTVEGDIQIKDLVGRERIGVYTYDPTTGNAFITDAINIRLTQHNADMVRVMFDGGTHLDCTPNHKILTFVNGNQNAPVREYEVMAGDLKPGTRVRAIRFRTHAPSGYIIVEWARRGRERQHRMVYEYTHSVKLSRKDHIHHRDEQPGNNIESNLQKLTTKEHAAAHYERLANWARTLASTLTQDHYIKIGTLNRGKKRSMESRLARRERMLGEKNPTWKGGRYAGRSRIDEVNHKVVSVTPIGAGDVYDMEVPSTHWFYANNVLVHNCVYCAVHCIMGYKFRPRSPENVVAEIKYWVARGHTHFQFTDDNFTFDMNRAKRICDLIIQEQLKIKWNVRNGIRVDKVDKELLQKMKDSGCYFIFFGMESGSQEILKSIKKGTTIDQIKNAVALTKEVGLPAGGTFMIGHPDETYKDFEMSLSLAKSLELTECRFYNILPYPGTELFDWIKEQGRFIYQPEDYLNTVTSWNNKPVFETPYFTEKERKMAYNEGHRLYMDVLWKKQPEGSSYIKFWLRESLSKTFIGDVYRKSINIIKPK